MSIQSNELEKLIRSCAFKYETVDKNTFVLTFQTQSYINQDALKRLSVYLRLQHRGRILRISIPDAFKINQSQTPSAVLMTLSIICFHVPVLSFGFDPSTSEIRFQSDVLIADSQLTEQQLHQYIELLLKVCDAYFEEIQHAIHNGTLHPRFRNAQPSEEEEDTAEKLSRLKNYLDELQKLVNDVDDSPSDSNLDQESESEESSDDLEWL